MQKELEELQRTVIIIKSNLSTQMKQSLTLKSEIDKMKQEQLDIIERGFDQIYKKLNEKKNLITQDFEWKFEWEKQLVQRQSEPISGTIARVQDLNEKIERMKGKVSMETDLKEL